MAPARQRHSRQRAPRHARARVADARRHDADHHPRDVDRLARRRRHPRLRRRPRGRDRTRRAGHHHLHRPRRARRPARAHRRHDDPRAGADDDVELQPAVAAADSARVAAPGRGAGQPHRSVDHGHRARAHHVCHRSCGGRTRQHGTGRRRGRARDRVRADLDGGARELSAGLAAAQPAARRVVHARVRARAVDGVDRARARLIECQRRPKNPPGAGPAGSRVVLRHPVRRVAPALDRGRSPRSCTAPR